MVGMGPVLSEGDARKFRSDLKTFMGDLVIWTIITAHRFLFDVMTLRRFVFCVGVTAFEPNDPYDAYN